MKKQATTFDRAYDAMTKDEHEMARQIALKFLSDGWGSSVDATDIIMDLVATNLNYPLDFQKLLSFDRFNLAHDVVGISNHLCRLTFELKGFFRPRCAKPTPEVAA